MSHAHVEHGVIPIDAARPGGLGLERTAALRAGMPDLVAAPLAGVRFTPAVDAPRGRIASPPTRPLRPAGPGPRPSAAPCLQRMEPFTAWLLGRAGLVSEHYRSTPLQRRIPACLRALRARSPEAARIIIEAQPHLLTVALDALLLGVTEFFRDAQVFSELAQLLPTLGGDRTGVRVWSAACSEGQELYSVAMLLDEAGCLQGSHLRGTDCRPEAVARARSGVYDAIRLRGLSEERCRRFLLSGGTSWHVVDRLRAQTTWEVEDLFRSRADVEWDLILWRNHAIYLEPAGSAALWHHLGGQLRPGGLMVTGKAERPPADLQLTRVAPCIYRKTWSHTP